MQVHASLCCREHQLSESDSSLRSLAHASAAQHVLNANGCGAVLLGHVPMRDRHHDIMARAWAHRGASPGRVMHQVVDQC